MVASCNSWVSKDALSITEIVDAGLLQKANGFYVSFLLAKVV